MQRAAFDVEWPDRKLGPCIPASHDDHATVGGQGSDSEIEIGVSQRFPEDIDTFGKFAS